MKQIQIIFLTLSIHSPRKAIEIIDECQNVILSEYESFYNDPNTSLYEIQSVRSEMNENIRYHEPNVPLDSYNVEILKKILRGLQNEDIERLKKLIGMKRTEAMKRPENRHPNSLINRYLTEGCKICLEKFRLKLVAIFHGMLQNERYLVVSEGVYDAIKGHLQAAIKELPNLKVLLAAPAVEHSPNSVLNLATALDAIEKFKRLVNQVYIGNVNKT